ncbi:MAG: acyl-ACP--UDP-N-acetylglucosamine O-acyltransferase [Paludibacteraceae bacterium]|nr:acyl-ACP--UDP-N-acetylglucosamine O-acyltransferase [Paludibacteraceae bacterium]
MISPLAYVHPDAKLAASVEVGPFVFIDKDVEIGEGTVIDANATICEHTRIGARCHIFPSAVVGAIPQDLKFKGELTYTYIGDDTVLRECTTVHRGTASKGKTVVGNHCLIMAYCHVAHDVVVKDYVIMSNATQLAGEVVVEDHAVIGGGTLVHQFTHIGAHVMIQGGTHLNKDVPPYIIAARMPAQYSGINSVGLNRRGFTKEQIDTIQRTYQLLFLSQLNTTQAIAQIEQTIPQSAERDLILNFVRESSAARGIIKG